MASSSVHPASPGDGDPSSPTGSTSRLATGPSAAVAGADAPFGLAAALRAVLMLTGSTYVSYFLGLLCSAIIARHLGPTDYGRYAYLIWLSGLMVMLCNNGLPTTAIRFVAESAGRNAKDDAHRIRRHLQRYQFRDLLICSTLLALALPWMAPAGWEGHLWWLTAVVVLSAAPKALYLFDISIAKGWGLFDIEARVTVIVTVVSTIAIGIAALIGASLNAYLALFVLAGLTHYALAHWQLRTKGLLTATPGGLPPDLRERVNQHLWWTVVLCVIAAFSNRSFETVLLNAYVGPAEVGYFAIAVALSRGGAELLCAGPNAIVMPAMGHAYGAGGFDAVRGLLSRAIRYFAFLGLVLVGVGVGGAQAAILIMYGTQYQPAVDVLRVLMLAAGLTLPMGVLGALLSTTDNQKLRAAVAALWLAIGALSAWVLIPRFGLDGAMLASAGSSLLIFVAVLGTISRWLSVRLPRRELLRLYLAGAVATLICVALARLLVTPPAGLATVTWQAIVQAGCGGLFAVLFALLTVLFGAWNQSDAGPIRLIAQYVPGLRRLHPVIDRWTQGLAPEAD